MKIVVDRNGEHVFSFPCKMRSEFLLVRNEFYTRGMREHVSYSVALMSNETIIEHENLQADCCA